MQKGSDILSSVDKGLKSFELVGLFRKVNLMTRGLATSSIQSFVRSLFNHKGVSVIAFLGFILRLRIACLPRVDIDESVYVRAALSYLEGDWNLYYAQPMVAKFLYAGGIAIFKALFPHIPVRLMYIIPFCRIVAILFGTLTCVVIYFLTIRVLKDKKAGLVAATILAFDPYAIGQSSLALLDPIMTFFSVLSVFFFLRFIEDGKFSLGMSAVTFGLAVGSKYTGFITGFTLLGIMILKQRFRKNMKYLVFFFLVALLTFFATQPYLWTNPAGNFLRSWEFNEAHLSAGHVVRVPGKPFVIPESDFNQATNNSLYLASKPDLCPEPPYSCKSGPSPWWYMIYIQLGYSTPFQIAGYALYVMILLHSLARRKLNKDSLGLLLYVAVPTIYYAIQPVRLPQYAIFSVVFCSVLVSSIWLSLNKTTRFVFILILLSFHVVLVCVSVAFAGDVLLYYKLLTTPSLSLLRKIVLSPSVSAWTYYRNPLISIIESFFGWLYEMNIV